MAPFENILKNARLVCASATLRKYTKNNIALGTDNKEIDIIIRAGSGYRVNSFPIFDFIKNHHNALKSKKIVLFDANEIDTFLYNKLANEFCLDIQIYPRLQRDELEILFQKSKVLINNSLCDGVSNLSVEAILNSCIVITSKNNAISEFYTPKQIQHYIFSDPFNEKLVLKIININEKVIRADIELIQTKLLKYFSDIKIEKLVNAFDDVTLRI